MTPKSLLGSATIAATMLIMGIAGGAEARSTFDITSAVDPAGTNLVYHKKDVTCPASSHISGGSELYVSNPARCTRPVPESAS